MIIYPNSPGKHSAVECSLAARAQGLEILDVLAKYASEKLVKTASFGTESLSILKAVIEALEKVGIEANVKSVSDLQMLSKQAEEKKNARSKDESIRIASKEIKDSHFNIDVSKNVIEKDGKELEMVSFLMTDAYLGRYIIKRNFYYLPSNVKEAEDVFEELVRKSKRVKAQYLSSKMAITDIKPEVKAFLDCVHGDFESDRENSLGTTVKRDKENGHEASGPPYLGTAWYK